jgi:L-gulonolactone oxidase
MGTVRARPAAIAEPRTVAEIAEAIGDAERLHRSVRVVGAGSAWSPLVPTDGVILSMRHQARIRSIDRARCRITVEAGALVGDVVRAAARNGMSVKSASMFLGLSVGGLIATGSHGTGRSYATFGDGVVALEIVKADGEIATIESPGTDLWRAAICNLGTLGVVTAVTLQCEPLFNVLETHVRVHVSEAAPLLPSILRDYEFVSLFWYPASKWAVFKLGNRTTLPAEEVSGRLNPSFAERASSWAANYMPALSRKIPLFDHVVQAAFNASVDRGTRVVSEPAFSHYRQVYPRCVSAEFAVPLEFAVDAWTWLSLRLGQYTRADVSPVNLTAHARFTGPSRALLASAGGRPTCHLEVLCVAGNRQRALFQSEFHQKMTATFEGRPHWGKEIVSPWQAARRYGEDLERFLEIRRALDPKQRFLNAFLRDEVFGLGRRAVRAVVRAEAGGRQTGAVRLGAEEDVASPRPTSTPSAAQDSGA